MTAYRKSTLPNGLRIITEEIPHVRSASIGVWVAAGSVWESTANMGISHFIEHMLFKGTATRTSRQIAREIDGRGGSLNAFTSKEQTCYYVKVLDEHLPIAVDVLADMLRDSLFDPAEIEKEKGVIVEEIKMYEDVPDDLVHDLFAAAMWSDHALGRPIVGTAEIVQSLTREQIMGYFHDHYVGGNIVIAAAGRIEHDRVVELVAAKFGWLAAGGGQRSGPGHPAKADRPRALIRSKETEQTHLVLGMAGLPQEHRDLYALHLLNTVLGGGASSRLFQEIREERGLAYSVYSFQASFRETGSVAVYAGVSPGVMEQVLTLVQQSLRQAGEQGITAEELLEAKEQLKGQIMLGLESTSGRMTRLGRGELMLGRVLTPDEIIARIDCVTGEEVLALAGRLFLQEPQVLSAVGPFGKAVNLKDFGFDEVRHG